MSKKTILSRDRKTGIDICISYVAFIFDLNFDCSFQYIKEKDYINKLINRFHYQFLDTKIKWKRLGVFP